MAPKDAGGGGCFQPWFLSKVENGHQKAFLKLPLLTRIIQATAAANKEADERAAAEAAKDREHEMWRRNLEAKKEEQKRAFVERITNSIM